MYYRIVKEEDPRLNSVLYTIEYSKDRFYGWKIMFSNHYGHNFSFNDVLRRYNSDPRYVKQLHENNHKTHKREIIKYFKD